MSRSAPAPAPRDDGPATPAAPPVRARPWARRALAGFGDSLLVRVVVLMTLGSAFSATLALWLAERAGQAEFEMARNERVVQSATDVAHRLASAPAVTEQLLLANKVFGAVLLTEPPADSVPQPDLQAPLRVALGEAAHATAAKIDTRLCPLPDQGHAAGAGPPPPGDCWLVRFIDTHGETRYLALAQPPRLVSQLDPVYFLLILAGAGILSLVVARLATAPLDHLSRAAQAFSLGDEVEPIPERGPLEVREALATFNLMQARVRAGVVERTQLLAAIAHDLQTPLTRMRLRLEQVPDDELRQRLVADMTALQSMVRNGLNLARGAESREEWSVLALDSLLESVAEDAAETGADVSFAGGCAARVRVKTEALTRCLGNLLDNAVKYGGSAELASHCAPDAVVVTVRDRGPGIPETLLPRLFEPFVRGSVGHSDPGRAPAVLATRPDTEPARTGRSDGTGIGLTIARAQAALFGGTVELANHPDGGAVATVRWPGLTGQRV